METVSLWLSEFRGEISSIVPSMAVMTIGWIGKDYMLFRRSRSPGPGAHVRDDEKNSHKHTRIDDHVYGLEVMLVVMAIAMSMVLIALDAILLLVAYVLFLAYFGCLRVLAVSPPNDPNAGTKGMLINVLAGSWLAIVLYFAFAEHAFLLGR